MQDGEIEVVITALKRMLRRGEYTPSRPAFSNIPPMLFEKKDCKSLMQNFWLRLSDPFNDKTMQLDGGDLLDG